MAVNSSDNVQPFTITVPQEALDDLYLRLSLTRWTDEVPGAGWDYGANLAYMKELVAYWQDSFDWRQRERELNALPHFRATIDGINIHFIHQRGNGPQPFPLILTHGWPSSFFEMLKVLPMLTDPASYGGDPADAFDVVIPSLPGYGFSERPLVPEQSGRPFMAERWLHLMRDVLGYSRFGAHGGDIGGGVTCQLGRLYPQQVAGIHLNGISIAPYLGPDAPALSEKERAYYAEVARWDAEEGAYSAIQETKPQTLSYGLNDSPVGLAAWIVEKFRAWSDCDGDVERHFSKDDLLTNISLYWFTQSINSSFGPYYVYSNKFDESIHGPLRKGERVETPCAVSLFPKNIDRPPRELGERVYNLQRWTEMPRGGHFPAHEEPELLVADIRTFFRSLR